MILATAYDFVFDQGTTIERVLTWRRDGSPLDLTGWNTRMEVRDKYGGTLLYRLDPTIGNLILGGVAGTLTLVIPADVSAGWTWRGGLYDIEVIDPGGKVGRLLQGKIKLNPEVTTGA